jgi:hypothetical protein
MLLRRAGIRLTELAREVAPSALAGVAIVGFTYAVARSISLPLVICLVAGLFGMAVVACLLFLKRRKLALIRSPRMETAAP